MLSTTVFESKEITPVDKTHIFLKGETRVRGKTHTTSGHFHLWTDGKWHLGDENKKDWERSQYAYFLDTMKDRHFVVDPTANFKKEAIEAMEAFVNEWTPNNAETIWEAHQRALQQRLDVLREKHQDAKKILMGIGKELGAARFELEQWNKEH